MFCDMLAGGSIALQKKELLLQGKTVTFHPHTQSAMSESATEDDTEPIRTLMLTGFKVNADKGKIEYFLETKKRSGGGEIADFSYNSDEQYAIVTFTNEQGRINIVCVFVCQISFMCVYKCLHWCNER